MFTRKITCLVNKTVSTFPVTVITGPRQSGKTTLLKSQLPNYRYISLESPDTLLRVQSDPRSELEQPTSLIIDEAQCYPAIFSYLQEYTDQSQQAGKFVLSGSQNFLLLEKVSQSLAGRAAVLELLPLSYSEFCTHPNRQELGLWDYLFHGSYPRPYQEHLDVQLWYDSYIKTCLERDVRSLVHVRDLSRFQLFLKLCAGRHGQLLNLSALGNECGISQTTAVHWLGILEASYIVFRLMPYYRNFNKRLVKTPKLYFYDSAIVSRLLGIASSEHLALHAQRSAIFEGFIITEVIKHFRNQGKSAPIYFWRDKQGNEIDLIIEQANQLIGLEIKSSKTIVPEMLHGLQQWQQQVSALKTYLIYAGDLLYQYPFTQIVPWHKVEEILS